MKHCPDCGRPATLRRRLTAWIAEYFCARCNTTYLR